MNRHPRWTLGFAVGLLVAPAAHAREAGRPLSEASAERAYSVQLHLHGPLSEFNGSMDWHVQKAHQAGIDVLWWTEHDWRMALDTYTRRFDFEHATWDAANHRFAEPDTAGEQRWCTVMSVATPYEASVVDSVAHDGARSLRLSLTGDDPGRFRTFELVLGGSRRQSHYPLAANVHVRFALRPDSFDPANDKFVVRAELCEHATDWPVLRYVAGTMDGEDASAISLPYVAGQWNEFDLDLSGDARRLLSLGRADTLSAEDNNLSELRIVLAARGDTRPVVFFDDVRFDVDEARTGIALLQWQRRAADWYESMVSDVSQNVGFEISRYRPQSHMNAYLPPHSGLVNYAGHTEGERLYWAVQEVHAMGGLVSYNHAFGTGVSGPPETPEQRAARILAEKRGELATRLYGCDLMEVGYRVRGGMDLAGHLEVWDCLASNGIFATGLGVTDSHGSEFIYGWAPWQASDRFENNYVTWVWATGKTELPLLRGLAAGRAYFGDPYRWKGELDVATAEGFRMGSVVLTDKASDDVVVRATNVPASVEVRLRQGEIRTDSVATTTDVHWLRAETLPASVVDGVLTDTVNVDLGTPTFVRFELWNDGREWAFSNPVYFLRAVPREGIPGSRLAASLGALRVLGAERLVLRGAALETNPSRLTLEMDEAPPGLGSVDVDASALGPPTSVRGAASWAYEDGILSLRGFQGTGSSVTASWAGGALIPADRVDISAGRPNPFGNGIVADYALPDPGLALIEVLDVTGRRVRILRDEWTAAGRHDVAWKGDDSSGRPVANGVYWLRLRALGITRTTKAVKVR